ncbi:MAG: 30S ribosomal protein S4 [Clostridia bacterium]
MAKYTGADCRMCRREGCKLFLKGDRCFSKNCALDRRPNVPGQHGAAKKKLSPYAVQFREKQKAKRIYGLCEKQFKLYYDKAEKMRGITGTNMLVLLERRLDNVVYRLGLGTSRSHARQLVNHGLICVNGAKVDIPSYLIIAGDVISVKENKMEKTVFANMTEKKVNLPKWLDFNAETLTGKILALPEREDIDLSIEEHLIVELYSK